MSERPVWISTDVSELPGSQFGFSCWTVASHHSTLDSREDDEEG